MSRAEMYLAVLKFHFSDLILSRHPKTRDAIRALYRVAKYHAATYAFTHRESRL